jgi:hypothetical protein
MVLQGGSRPIRRPIQAAADAGSYQFSGSGVPATLPYGLECMREHARAQKEGVGPVHVVSLFSASRMPLVAEPRALYGALYLIAVGVLLAVHNEVETGRCLRPTLNRDEDLYGFGK